MEALFKHATIAWNPMSEARRRIAEGTLNPGSVFVPFLAVVIACNLVTYGAQTFYFEALAFHVGMEMPDLPLLSNDFSRRTLSALGALVPAATVALLPTGIFAPAGRRATVASIVVLGAAWAFYGAAIGAPINFISGVLATADPNLGMTAFMLLSIPGSLVIFGLLIWFWISVLRGVLGLRGGAVVLILFCALGSQAALVALFVMVLSASPF